MAHGGGRLRPAVTSALTFTVGALIGAVAWFGLLGLIGGLIRPVLLPIAILGFGFSFVWHGRHSGLVPFARRSIEANRRLVRGVPGLIYFGALLGIGVITEMSTPLVWAGALLSVAVGLPFAIFYAAGFALGRSSPAMASVLSYRWAIDYGALSGFIVGSMRQPLRYVALVAALTGAATATIAALAAMAGS